MRLPRAFWSWFFPSPRPLGRIHRSKRPGRSSAGSRTSGRLVAARTMTPAWDSNPCISTNSWLRVCSLSSFEIKELERLLPMASNSSMNIMQGACSRACLNMSRTRAAPTPTIISTKAAPLIWKNGTFASPATALASRVLPVPGGPTSKTPFGISLRLPYIFPAVSGSQLLPSTLP